MKRLKTFLTYTIIIVAFWIFSDILIYLSINSTYKHKEAKIYTSSPEIIITQNRATYVNGVVKGSVKNNTNDIINNKYLKIDMYSSRNVKLGTKYINIQNLKLNDSIDFEMWYRFTDVDYVTITTVDEIQDYKQEEFLSQEASMTLIVGALLYLYFI